MLAWGVFDKELTQISFGFWTPPPFYLHLYFWATTFFPIRCVQKASLPTPSLPPPFSPLQPLTHTQTHKLTRYHHLTYKAFKYLLIKSCQLVIRLKKNREQEKNIAFCFQNNVYKKTQRVSSKALVFRRKFSCNLSGI